MVGVREAADVGEVVHLAAGEVGEDVGVGRPPVALQAQVAAPAAAVIAVPIPRHHHPSRNLGIARSAVEVEVHRVSLRG